MNPLITDYLKKKYGENFEEDAKAKYNESLDSNNTANLFSNLGDVIAGKNVGSNNAYFQKQNELAKENTIGKIEKDKKSFIEGSQFDNEQKQAKIKQDAFDPNSNQSISFRNMMEAKFPDVAKSYGDSWNNVTAGDMDNIFKPLQLKEQMEARKEQARILAGDKRDKAEEKKNEKLQSLTTPLGIANNEDDAKKLKEAYESKKNFDNKINDMIALREKHKGGAILNREDVARGKQLSKDLLLEYKNMAKLGVLSQSDENIINAIIPEDPLQYNSFAAAIQDQDPTLHRLKEFKKDSDKDFATRVQTRTRDGGAKYAQSLSSQQELEKKIVKTQTNKKTGEKRVVYNDGTSEIIKSVAGGQ